MSSSSSALPLKEGVLPALWIPTDPQGRFMESEFVHILKRCADAGVVGFMVLGTTGEFLHLDLPTRKRVLEVAVQNAGSRPVLANISDIRPSIVSELGNFARDLGVAAISLLPPYYYPLHQEDLTEFFVRSAETAKLPVFLYNFPERVGYKISLDTIRAVADRVPMFGIKQSGADFDYHRDLVALGREKDFSVITGSDTMIPEAMAMGVSGVVSGLSNAVADLVVTTYRKVKAGQSREAIPEAQALVEIRQLLGRMEFPYNIAALMRARGLPIGTFKHITSASCLSRFEELTRDYCACLARWNLQ